MRPVRERHGVRDAGHVAGAAEHISVKGGAVSSGIGIGRRGKRSRVGGGRGCSVFEKFAFSLFLARNFLEVTEGKG
jgi:hypothetical protein